jgi:hypothetical protein
VREKAFLLVEGFRLRNYKLIVMPSEMALSVKKDRRWFVKLIDTRDNVFNIEWVLTNINLLHFVQLQVLLLKNTHVCKTSKLRPNNNSPTRTFNTYGIKRSVGVKVQWVFNLEVVGVPHV